MIYRIAYDAPEMRHQWTTQILTNIVADYLSLFIVRRWLVTASDRPFLSLLLAPLFGALVIIACYLVRDVGGFSISTRSFHPRYFLEDIVWWIEAIRRPSGSSRTLLLPALVVHFWLPLFAIGTAMAKSLALTLNAVRWSQWFLKAGNSHPIRTIGVLASVFVFLVLALLRLVA